jgi:alpha-glucuronidase
VARVVDGSAFGHARTGIAGVANGGDDRDGCGADFNQANWYAVGRRAGDPPCPRRGSRTSGSG